MSDTPRLDARCAHMERYLNGSTAVLWTFAGELERESAAKDAKINALAGALMDFFRLAQRRLPEGDGEFHDLAEHHEEALGVARQLEAEHE